MRKHTIAMAAAVVTAVTFVAVPATAGATGASSGTGTPIVDRIVGSGFSDRQHGSFGQKSDLKAVGLADAGKTLVRFTTERPERAAKVGKIGGLAGDTYLVGIDYRVQNGKLYGVGNMGGLYTVSDRDASATKVGQLSVPLSGTYFGVDFNPAAIALRVVSDNGQNLRQPFGTTDGPSVATVVDGALNYMAGVPAAGVSAVAYTNNDLNADSATTLFDVDTALDQIAIQAPANAGSLSATGKVRLDADPDAGIDIYTTVRKDRTVDLTAFAVLGKGGSYRLYGVDLLTALVDDEGAFKFPVTDIAIGLNQR